MIQKIISGGQSGADQAGWRAGRQHGLATAGWMPRGYLTEDGPRPEFANLYGATEHTSSEYPPRTKANVQDAQLTIWFGRINTAGYWCTRRAANSAFKPFWEISRPPNEQLRDVTARNIVLLGYKIINIAGNRESVAPGIGAWVEEYLGEVLGMLRG